MTVYSSFIVALIVTAVVLAVAVALAQAGRRRRLSESQLRATGGPESVDSVDKLGTQPNEGIGFGAVMFLLIVGVMAFFFFAYV